MIPKKLFTPKCLHADREVVFHEDIQNFYNYFFSKLKEDYREFLLSKKISIKENLIQDEEIFEIINNEETFNYSIFKKYWREKKMSMLHFSKSKEENAKEYYEVLFGEVQYFMNISNRNSQNNQNLTFMYKIISFLTLYSLYYTQTTEFFYQINTTPEILREFNFVISTLKEKFLNKKITREIIAMLNRLYEEDSFSIGALIGLKTIILNKYGLPMEQKQKVYKEYSDIADSVKLIEKNKIEEKEKRKNYMQSLDEYTDVKRQALTLIKATKGENLNELYCEFINLQLNESKKPYLTSNSILPNYDINKIIISDLQENKITNLDLQFNQVDNNIFTKERGGRSNYKDEHREPKREAYVTDEFQRGVDDNTSESGGDSDYFDEQITYNIDEEEPGQSREGEKQSKTSGNLKKRKKIKKKKKTDYYENNYYEKEKDYNYNDKNNHREKDSYYTEKSYDQGYKGYSSSSYKNYDKNYDYNYDKKYSYEKSTYSHSNEDYKNFNYEKNYNNNSYKEKTFKSKDIYYDKSYKYEKSYDNYGYKKEKHYQKEKTYGEENKKFITREVIIDSSNFGNQQNYKNFENQKTQTSQPEKSSSYNDFKNFDANLRNEKESLQKLNIQDFVNKLDFGAKEYKPRTKIINGNTN